MGAPRENTRTMGKHFSETIRGFSPADGKLQLLLRVGFSCDHASTSRNLSARELDFCTPVAGENLRSATVQDRLPGSLSFRLSS